MKTPRMILVTQFGILALAIGSFSISFAQIMGAALSVGIIFGLAIVYGILAEGFIALATYVAWVARGTRRQWFPWFVAFAGFAFSLWANARTSENPAEAVIHGMPVIALPLAVHLLITLTEAWKEGAAAEEAAEVVAKANAAAARIIADAEAILNDATSRGPIVEYVEVPAEIRPDTIEVDKVTNPRAVGYRLLWEVAVQNGDKKSASHFKKQFTTALAGA